MTLDAEPVGQNQPTQNAASESPEQPSATQPKVTDIPAPVQTDSQKPPYHCNITCKQEKNWWDKAKPFVEIVGIVLLFVYTLYTIKMYCANRDAANAAKKSADVAETTLVATNRPWLDIQLSIAGPLTFNETGAHITVLAEISNVGHSPAVRVTNENEFIQVMPSGPNPVEEIKEQCRQASGQSASPSNRGLTQTIFPSKPQQQNWLLLMNPAELRKDIPSREGAINPLIVWCVAYRADFSEVQHHIGYAWIIGRKDGTALRKSGPVPGEQLSNNFHS